MCISTSQDISFKAVAKNKANILTFNTRPRHIKIPKVKVRAKLYSFSVMSRRKTTSFIHDESNSGNAEDSDASIPRAVTVKQRRVRRCQHADDYGIRRRSNDHQMRYGRQLLAYIAGAKSLLL